MATAAQIEACKAYMRVDGDGEDTLIASLCDAAEGSDASRLPAQRDGHGAGGAVRPGAVEPDAALLRPPGRGGNRSAPAAGAAPGHHAAEGGLHAHMRRAPGLPCGAACGALL